MAKYEVTRGDEVNCDKCKFYNWYYDWCERWHCEVDGKAVYPWCFKHRN